MYLARITTSRRQVVVQADPQAAPQEAPQADSQAAPQTAITPGVITQAVKAIDSQTSDD